MSSAAAFAPERVQSEVVDVWAAAVERGLPAGAGAAAQALKWSPCSLDKLEIGDQRWWAAEFEGASPLRVWVGVSSVGKELDSLSSALAAADDPGAPAKFNLASDAAIEGILHEFIEIARQERDEELSLRSFRQAPNPPPSSNAFVTRSEEGRPLIIAVFQREGAPTRTAPNGRQAERASFGQLLNIDLPLSIRLGKARMPIEDVLRLKVGSMFELDRAHDDPVDLVVNGAVVARGELVAVDGVCGLRVREVLRSEGSIQIENA